MASFCYLFSFIINFHRKQIVNKYSEESNEESQYNILQNNWLGMKMSILLKYLTVLGMAALPVLELRGSVPWGVAQDLPLLSVLIVSIIGNMIPVPFIILFLRKVLAWMKQKSRRLSAIAEKIEHRGRLKGDILVKYEILGLFILVAIPLPGTGAWTGSLVAAMFDLRLKNAIPAIFLGVVAAGIIMSVISYGIDMLI